MRHRACIMRPRPSRAGRHGPGRACGSRGARRSRSGCRCAGTPATQAQFLDGGEAPHPQQVLLERPDEALDAAVALGLPPSRRSILASSSSVVMVRSPTLALRRPISRSRPSAGRAFSAASPAARKASRQALSSAAVTPSSRDTSSRSSPATDARPRSACAWPTAAGVAQALARLRQRDGRAPPGQRPVPSCPSCSPPRSPSIRTRRCLT